MLHFQILPLQIVSCFHPTAHSLRDTSGGKEFSHRHTEPSKGPHTTTKSAAAPPGVGSCEVDFSPTPGTPLRRANCFIQSDSLSEMHPFSSLFGRVTPQCQPDGGHWGGPWPPGSPPKHQAPFHSEISMLCLGRAFWALTSQPLVCFKLCGLSNPLPTWPLIFALHPTCYLSLLKASLKGDFFVFAYKLLLTLTIPP